MFVCLFVFNVPSTARSFRDGTPIYCPLRRTWSSVNTPSRPGIEPGAVAWQFITLPLRHGRSIIVDLTNMTALSNSYSNACIPSMMVFGMTLPGREPTTNSMKCGHGSNNLSIHVLIVHITINNTFRSRRSNLRVKSKNKMFDLVLSRHVISYAWFHSPMPDLFHSAIYTASSVGTS